MKEETPQWEREFDDFMNENGSPEKWEAPDIDEKLRAFIKSTLEKAEERGYDRGKIDLINEIVADYRVLEKLAGVPDALKGAAPNEVNEGSTDTNKTPQWEIRFDNEFAIQDDVWGKAKYGESTIYPPSKVKAFIKSTLEEVIDKADKNMEQASGGGSWRRVWIQTKAQLRKEFLND